MEKLNPAERWGTIPGCKGYYEASDFGRVRSTDRFVTRKNGQKHHRRGVLLKQQSTKAGYLYLAIYIDGNKTCNFVHSLVLETFIGLCPDGMECCHGNGNPADNHLQNLRWGTHSDNMQDMLRHGTNAKRSRIACPLGHLLAVPNLRAKVTASGHRTCLACSRANDYGRYCKIYGLPFNRRAEADEYYRRIMAGDPGNRHKTCKRGHLLDPPNIPKAAADRGKIACLACRRTGNNRHDARKAGRPFDFQAVSDLHYKRIMAGDDTPLTGASHVL